MKSKTCPICKNHIHMDLLDDLEKTVETVFITGHQICIICSNSIKLKTPSGEVKRGMIIDGDFFSDFIAKDLQSYDELMASSGLLVKK